MKLRHIDLIGQPIVIGIHHRIIARQLNFLAECIDHSCQVCRRKCAHLRRFHIDHNRIGDRIIFDQIQNKICLCFRHRNGSRVRINISTDFQTCIVCIDRIGSEIRIHFIVISSAQHNERNIICRYFFPVNGLFPMRNINASVQHTCDRRTVTADISAGSILLPGSRISCDLWLHRHGNSGTC